MAVVIVENPNALFQFAANDFSQRAIAAVKDKGVFSVVLSGGHTPLLFFDLLTRTEKYKKDIPWGQIQFFFGDERYVSIDNSQNNYHQAYEHLFSKVPVNPDNIHRIPTEFSDPHDAAKQYEKTLRDVFDLTDNNFPLFDVVYLGLGENAHTASLMPFNNILLLPRDDHQLVASLVVSESNLARITLTPNAINHAKDIIFLVSGENKSTAVKEVLEGQLNTQKYPAQLIHSMQGKTMWYLDKAAAGKLTTIPP